jgi:hypothetical protein
MGEVFNPVFRTPKIFSPSGSIANFDLSRKNHERSTQTTARKRR